MDTNLIPEQVEVKRLSKVVIVAYAPSSRDLAPVLDPECEVWGLNDLHVTGLPRITRWFDIHPRESLFQKNRNEHHYKWLCQPHPFPVFMQEHYDEFPSSVRYPIEAMTERFGDYWTNSVSYMLALAIAEGFKTIYLYGVDMALDSEYKDQKPSCEYIIGFARGLGIEVVIPMESDLLKSAFRYGYNCKEARTLAQVAEKRKAELQGRINGVQGQMENMKVQLYQLIGALENNEHYHKNHFNVVTSETPPLTLEFPPEQVAEIVKTGKVTLDLPMRRG